MKKYLTPKETAEVLRIKPVTLYVWIHRGVDIPHVRIEGTIRFEEESLQAWIDQKSQNNKRREFR